MHEFYAWIRVLYTEALAGEGAAVDFGVQVGEATGEFQFLAVDFDAAVGGLSVGLHSGRQIRAIEREQPVYIGVGQFQCAAHAPGFGNMQFAAFHVSEQPQQQIEKMHAYVCRDATGLFHLPLPRIIIPQSPCGDIVQLHDVPLARRFLAQLLPQCQYRGMDAQAARRSRYAAGFGFEFGEGVEIPGVENDGLLADGVGADTQCQPYMRVMQMIGRTDAEIIDAMPFRSAPQLLKMPVETLEFLEKTHIGKIPVQYAHGIMRITGSQQGVTRILDGPEMPRRYVAGNAGQCEV
jgi:hypothetical protein